MIPFIDLHAQHKPIRHEIDQAIAEVLDSGQFIRGPFVARFEEQVAQYVGTKHAIGVSSGTDALLASLMALGIGPGDEVITTAFTFCASAECILRVGATPVFVDIDPATFNLDAGLLEEAVTEKTRAILPVHLFGQCCDMDAILKVARNHDLYVVEDCAQAMGARFDFGARASEHTGARASEHTGARASEHTGARASSPGWKQAGSMSTIGCFSFFPTKNLGGIGDGGMITCNDDALAEQIRTICSHGCERKYEQVMAGGNFRLDAIQAAVLGVKLQYLDAWIEERRENAARYDEALAGVEGVITPKEAQGRRHTYNQYTVRVANRDAVRERLRDAGVGHGVYYPKGLQDQPAYQDVRCVPERLEVTEKASATVLSLPISLDLDAGAFATVKACLIDLDT